MLTLEPPFPYGQSSRQCPTLNHHLGKTFWTTRLEENGESFELVLVGQRARELSEVFEREGKRHRRPIR